MAIAGKITGLTMVIAGFTFFAWFVALNTISPAIPEGLQGTAKLFMVLSGVTGLGFLVSGGMALFGHEHRSEEQNAAKPAENSRLYKPLPKPVVSKPASAAQPPVAAESESDDVVIEVDEEKKKDGDNKAGWEAPSKTGWG